MTPNYPVDQSGAATERFLHLYSANRSTILAYIMTLLPNRNEAEDILQEVTAVMWRRFGEFEAGSDFVAWARTIARYKILDHCKRKQVVCFDERVIEALEQDVPAILDKFDHRMDALESCVAKLCQRDRMLVRLRYYEEHTVQKIADRLGQNIFAIYRAFGRIHRTLLECVRHHLAAEGVR